MDGQRQSSPGSSFLAVQHAGQCGGNQHLQKRVQYPQISIVEKQEQRPQECHIAVLVVVISLRHLAAGHVHGLV